MSKKVVAYRQIIPFNCEWRLGFPNDYKEGEYELAYSESHVRALEERCRVLAEALEGVMSLPMTEYPKALLPALVTAGKALAALQGEKA